MQLRPPGVSCGAVEHAHTHTHTHTHACKSIQTQANVMQLQPPGVSCDAVERGQRIDSVLGGERHRLQLLLAAYLAHALGDCHLRCTAIDVLAVMNAPCMCHECAMNAP